MITETINYIMPFFEYLWDIHWVFRLNFFIILYFIVGPSIICYMKPQMGLMKRSILIFSAILFSLMLCVFGALYSYEFGLYEHEECLKKLHLDPLEYNELCPLIGGDPSKRIEQPHIKQPSIEYIPSDEIFFRNLLILLIILPIIIIYSFMSFPLLIWFLWHRLTIKAMGKDFRGKKILFFMMFGCIWSFFIPIIIIKIIKTG